MITYTNIVNRFEAFVAANPFVQTFSFGSPSDVDLDKLETYPVLHLVYTGASYEGSSKTYSFEVYILDNPPNDESKVDFQKGAITNAEQIAEDILADMERGGEVFTFAHRFDVASASTVPLEEEGSNVMSGVLLNLSVTVGYEHDSCNSPLT